MTTKELLDAKRVSGMTMKEFREWIKSLTYEDDEPAQDEQKRTETLIDRWDAEEWLGEKKDVWNHPRIVDRNNKESYDLADLMAEYGNWLLGKFMEEEVENDSL